MSDTLGAKSPSEFMQLLEESGILRSSELRTARGMLPETRSSKLFARRLVAKGILTRWQAGQLLVGWTKLRLGNHKLCRQVGRGQFGRVFLAEHIQLQREVAIKTLSRRYTQQKEIVEQFLQDARQAAALDHRNLVHVLDIDSADDQYYMVMEYVVGRDLQRLVTSDGPLSPSQTAGLLCQAAGGLEYAHRAGVIHQAVRPANLMLDEKGVIKVLGLGVGRLTGSSESLADLQDGESVEQAGDYRAPEQRSGVTIGDARSDIFSLGCSAVYLLTGQPPAADRHDTAASVTAASATLSDEVSHIWADPPHEIPASLVEIIEKMVAVDPAQRFATALEVQTALEEWLAVHADEPPALPKATAQGVTGAHSADGGDERLAVANAIKAAMSSDVAGESRKTKPRTRLPQLSRRQRSVAAGALLGGVLLAVAAYFLWPSSTTTVAVRPARTTEKKAVTRASQPAQPKLRRRESRSKASETTLPAAGIGHDPPTPAEEPAGAEPSQDEPAKKVVSSNTPPNEKPAEPPEPKPEPPAEPEAKKEPLPPLVADNPLQELPVAIRLPGLDATDATTEPSFLDVAPMTETLAQQVEVVLLGGDHAAGKSGRYGLTASGPGTPRSWTIALLGKDESEESGEAIAHLAVQSGQLRYTWDAAASRHVLAPNVCNCVLRFTVGKHVHDMRLRTVEQIEPLMVNLKRPTVNQRWPIFAAPDPQHVRFEIQRLAAPFPAIYNLDPVAPIAADQKNVLVQFGSEELDDHVLLLEVIPQLGNIFRLECKASFRVSPELEPIPLSQKKFEVAVNFVAQKQQSLNLQAQQARAKLNPPPQQEQQRRALEESLKQSEAALTETSKAYARMEVLNEMRQAMAEGAALHFRLFYLADEIEVDLLRTAGQ